MIGTTYLDCLCQNAIARLFLFVFVTFSPQNDYCNKSTAGGV